MKAYNSNRGLDTFYCRIIVLHECEPDVLQTGNNSTEHQYQLEEPIIHRLREAGNLEFFF